MKKILYLAIVALGLQSCLKDKEHESEIFNGVGYGSKIIAFGSPNRISTVDVLDTKVAALPKMQLEDLDSEQVYEIEVQVLTKPFDKDLVVTLKNVPGKIAEYNTRRINDYYAVKGLYDIARAKYAEDLAAYIAAGGPIQLLIPKPTFPKEPAIYTSFEELPAGKFIFPTSVTIPKGATSVMVELIVPDASEATNVYKQFSKYMLPITLQTNADPDIVIPNPTLLLNVSRKLPNPYLGSFAYTGVQRFQSLTSDPSGAYTTNPILPSLVKHIWRESPDDPTITEVVLGGSLSPPSPASNAGFRMDVRFDPAASDPENRVIILGATVARPDFPLTVSPSVITKVTKGAGDPPLELVFDSKGNLDEVKNLWYTYSNANGVREFKQSSIKRIP